MSAAKRRKQKFAFKTSHLLLALLVFSVSVGATTTVASRMSQLALNNQGDLKCTPDKDYGCKCGTPKEKCPGKKLPGGKDCPCSDETNGITTPGKCQGVDLCKGTPPGGGDGKMPEMPKMPEPPKDSPPPPTNPQTDPCSASGGLGDVLSAVYRENGTTTKRYDANGQPCPNTGNQFQSGDLPGTSTATSSATSTATSTAHRFSWSAITRIVQDASNAVANSVGNAVSSAVRTAITTLGGNPNYGAPKSGTGNSGTSTTSSNGGPPLYYTSPDLNTFGAPKDSPSQDAAPKGMWDWLKGLMNLNP